MDCKRPAKKIPEAVAGTPVETVQTGPRLPCPHDDCGFAYWNIAKRDGNRVPAVEHEYSARDNPCQHFHTTWTGDSPEGLESALEDAAEHASELFCVVDKQLPLDDEQRIVAIYATRQTGLGAF